MRIVVDFILSPLTMLLKGKPLGQVFLVYIPLIMLGLLFWAHEEEIKVNIRLFWNNISNYQVSLDWVIIGLVIFLLVIGVCQVGRISQ